MSPSVPSPFSSEIKRTIYLKEHPSTNEYAMNSLSNSDPKQHTCVYTYNQTNGRGQIGRKWYSGTDKNISCSFKYYFSELKINDQFLINMSFSLAIYDFVSFFIPEEVCIKWPNDIYVGNKKIAGLLIQNVVRKDLISSTILGVGINVNEDGFPAELPNPISLFERTGADYTLLDLQHRLISCVEKRIAEITEETRTEYLAKLYRMDKKATYKIAGEEVEGTIRGVAEDGKLEMELRGRRRFMGFRELEFVI